MSKPAATKLPLAMVIAALLLAAASPAWSQLTCNLSVVQKACIGQKTPYTLTASASGCSGPYTFTWTNATRVSSTATTNPNVANRTVTPGECTITVSMSVSAMGYTCNRSVSLFNECDSACSGGGWEP